MLMLPPTVRIFLASASVDFRNGFDGLSAIVHESLGFDPASGDLFVFRNKSGDKMKVLFASRQGLCLFAKRLHRGVFRWPSSDAASCEIEAADLAVLLEGLEMPRRRDQPRERPTPVLR